MSAGATIVSRHSEARQCGSVGSAIFNDGRGSDLIVYHYYGDSDRPDMGRLGAAADSPAAHGDFGDVAVITAPDGDNIPEVARRHSTDAARPRVGRQPAEVTAPYPSSSTTMPMLT